MKHVCIHPLRDWWLRLKALAAVAAPPKADPRPAAKPKPHQRAIPFFDLP